MLDEVRALLILQDRDRRLAVLAKDLEKLPQEEMRAKNKLSGDTGRVKEAKEALVAAELRLKRLELDAGTRKTTILRLKTQQFETRKNDEYTALGHEVVRYEKEVDELETRELELMEELDRLRAVLKQAEGNLQKTTHLVEEELESIRVRRERLLGEVADTKAQRENLAAVVPENLLPLYERLWKIKAGVVVAPMQDGKCGGCHMKLIPSTVVAVQSELQVTRCEDCGRILYPA